MPRVDWTKIDELSSAPGIYNFEIEAADLKTSEKSGYEYINLRLRCVDDGSITIFDTLSFSPKAKGILQAKLSALGMQDAENIEPEMFLGRRVKVATKLEKDNKGDMRLIADIKAKGTHAGYFKPDDQSPNTAKKPVDLESDIPF